MKANAKTYFDPGEGAAPKNYSGNIDAIATKWIVRWRLFYLACSELFKYNDGEEWFVSHYRFVKK